MAASGAAGMSRLSSADPSAAVGFLPVRALAQILDHGYTPVARIPPQDFGVLAAWGAAGVAPAAWRFRWA